MWAISGRQGCSESSKVHGGIDLRISIVIPNFNSGPVLERALQSLVSQNYPDLELIMVDSESDDVSRDIIKRYQTRFSALIIEKDKGQADGLNKGFALATGDVYGWLCADDELMPGALRHVAQVFANRPETEALLGACERVYADGSRSVTPADTEPWSRICVQDVIEQVSTFWLATLHHRCGPLDTGFHLAFDWDFWCRMARQGARITCTDQVLARYYFSDNNKTSRSGDLFAREAFRVIRRYGPLKGRLAYIYMLLYQYFDLHGCYDKPPTCTRFRGLVFTWVLKILRATISTRLVHMYNWHFASLQQRGKRWW